MSWDKEGYAPLPTLMDMALAKHSPYLKRDYLNAVTRARPRARRFVFSRAASAVAGRFAFECGDLIIRNRQFAMPPYPTTYVEIDSRAWYRAANEAGYRFAGPVETSDLRVGYLFDGNMVYVFIDGPHKREGSVVPFGATLGLLAYKVVLPGEHAGRDDAVLSLDPQRTAIDVDKLDVGDRKIYDTLGRPTAARWGHIVAGLGSTTEYIDDEAIGDEWAIKYMGTKFPKSNVKVWDLLRSTAGEVRNMWTVLLWLNQPTKIVLVDQPAGAKLIRGHRVAYASHHVVEIDLGKVKVIRNAMKFEDRESPVRHTVRGSFHHRGGSNHCTHDWPFLPNDEGHWFCTKCGRMRYWVRDHVRGDATKGWAEKDYAVKIGENQ